MTAKRAVLNSLIEIYKKRPIQGTTATLIVNQTNLSQLPMRNPSPLLNLNRKICRKIQTGRTLTTMMIKMLSMNLSRKSASKLLRSHPKSHVPAKNPSKTSQVLRNISRSPKSSKSTKSSRSMALGASRIQSKFLASVIVSSSKIRMQIRAKKMKMGLARRRVISRRNDQEKCPLLASSMLKNRK